jgi:hypothetical protein
MSVEQLRDSGVKMCISLDQKDQDAINDMRRGQLLWYPSPCVVRRITHLRLNIRLQDELLLLQHVKPLDQICAIETLDVKYPSFGQQLYSSTTGLDLLSLQRLKQISLEQLYCSAHVLVKFFRRYARNLTSISLKSCSVSAGRYDMFGQVDIAPECTLLNVILELQTLPALSTLKLDRLARDQASHHRDLPLSSKDPVSRPRNLALDLDMSLCATWDGKEEIAIGLTYLKSTYSTIEAHVSYVSYKDKDVQETGCDGDSKDYLNLCFANFKVSARYTWTRKERESLQSHRHSCYITGPFREQSFLDDDTVFPVPSVEFPRLLPFGSAVLKDQFFKGNQDWQTVWINAPRELAS